MSNERRYNLPFNNDDLLRLEDLFAGAFDASVLTSLMRDCELPQAEIDPGGAIRDRWVVVVRECVDRDLLGLLIELAEKRLVGKKAAAELRDIIDSVRKRQADDDDKQALDAVELVRTGMERLLDLEDPSQSRQIAREIRSEALTLLRLIVNNKTIPYVITGGVVAEPSFSVSEKMVHACVDVMSSAERLIGVIQLTDDSLDDVESLQGANDPVLRQISLLDVKINARNRLVESIRKFLRIISKDVVLVSHRSLPETLGKQPTT
jgi:hypothetical protein